MNFSRIKCPFLIIPCSMNTFDQFLYNFYHLHFYMFRLCKLLLFLIDFAANASESLLIAELNLTRPLFSVVASFSAANFAASVVLLALFVLECAVSASIFEISAVA